MTEAAGRGFSVTEDQADRRLDRVLRGLFKDVPLGAIMKAVREGAVRVDGRKRAGDYRLAAGEAVTVPWKTNRESRGEKINFAAPRERLVTIFKNDSLWCVDKPAGLLSQPDKPGGDSLITRAWTELGWTRSDFRPAVAGRLDRNVSGVSAIALRAPALRVLSEAIRSGRVKKIYRAVVLGVPPAEGEISLPLYKEEGKNFVRAARRGEKSLAALTRFRRLAAGRKYSLVEIDLVTGRPHQARVHMASAGCPIAGDTKYGGPEARRMGRVMLHASKLVFPEDENLPGGVSGLEAAAPTPAEFGLLIGENII